MTKGVLQDLTLEEGDGQGEELESDVRWFLFTAQLDAHVLSRLILTFDSSQSVPLRDFYLRPFRAASNYATLH